MNTYLVGEKIKITGTFKEEGDLGDPAVIRASYKNPLSVITTLIYGTDSALIKESTGVYSFEIILNHAGFWYYRMDDGGANVAAEDSFQVLLSKVT